MRIDPFSHISAGMTKDTSFCCLIGSGIIEQWRYRMAAVVSGMPLGVDECYYPLPDSAIAAVGIWIPVNITNQ